MTKTDAQILQVVPTTGRPEGWEQMIRGGDRVVIRPLHAQDVAMERRFIEDLSPVSRRFRFLDSMKSPSEALLTKLTVLDPATDAAFVAVTHAGSQEHPIGVGRFSAGADAKDCEFAVTVADAWQQKGLGTVLMQHLIEVARQRGIDTMHSSDAWDNALMRSFAAHLGMRHEPDPDDAKQVVYSLDLTPSEGLQEQPT